METENINAMISSYERIEGEYSFMEFLKEANIKEGTYKCISDLLVRSWQTITVTLTEEQIKTLDYKRENNRHQVNWECADPITKKMTISGLEKIFGEMCQQKDERGKRLWLTEDGNLERFWGKDNKEQLDNYDYIANILAEYKDNKKNDIRLSFNQKSLDFTDDDVSQSIYTFFGLIRNDQEVVDYINTLLSVIDSKGQITTKSIDELLNSEKAPRFIARAFASLVKPDFINKNDNIRYNYKEIWKASNQDNVKYTDILNKVIISFLNESSKPYHFWSNFLKFLNILRLLRNALSHYRGSLVEEGEQLPVACFILHTYVGTFLAITKNLQNQDALLPYNERQKTLTVYYKQDLNRELFRNDKGEELSDEEEEEILKNLPKPRLFRVEKVEVEPFDLSKGYARYPIERGPSYTISWGEGKSAVEVSVPYDTLWKSASSNPIAIWNGVKYYFFSDLSTVYAELDPYIQNAQKKDVETLTGLVKTLNGIVSNLGSSTDANTEIVNGLKASVEKIQDKLNEINEGIKKGNKQRNVIIAMLGFLCVIIAIWFIFDLNDRFPFLSSNDDPITLIEKGDQYLKDGDAEKAGITYKKAIKAYEDILSEDSMNIDANIGLATMLMRGKGDFEPQYAELLANRVKGRSRRGEGLYVYLLTLNRKFDEAKKYINSKESSDKDEYIQLATEKLFVMDTFDVERSLEETRQACERIKGLNIPEAEIEYAMMLLYGVKRNATSDDYFFNPNPIKAISLLKSIVETHQIPAVIGELSKIYEDINHLDPDKTDNYINLGLTALECGVHTFAPITRMRILDAYFWDPGNHYTSILEKVTRITNEKKSIIAEISDLIQESVNYYKSGRVSIKDLNADLDTLISSIGRSKDQQGLLDHSRRMRVSYYLLDGNIQKATQIAMELDNYRDSVSVSNYLQVICYDMGWGGYPRDSIKRDSLLRVSAEMGYPGALYLRLWEAEPIQEIWEDKNGRNRPYITYTPITSFVKDSLERLSQKRDTASLVCHYIASSSTLIPDSVWKRSPEIATMLTDYFYPYYINNHMKPPYLDYCPKDYQIMYNTSATAYECKRLSNGSYEYKDKKLKASVTKSLMDQLQIGMSEALKQGDGVMFMHLVTMWVDLAKRLHLSDTVIAPYKEFQLEEYDYNCWEPYFPKFLNPPYY